MVISQGDVAWADFAEPRGSEPGYMRPVVVVQGNPLNRSRIETVLCVPLTSNLKWYNAPGNVSLSKKDTALSKKSVANVSQLTVIDREYLSEPVAHLPETKLSAILSGIDLVLDRRR